MCKARNTGDAGMCSITAVVHPSKPMDQGSSCGLRFPDHPAPQYNQTDDRSDACSCPLVANNRRRCFAWRKVVNAKDWKDIPNNFVR